MKILIVAVFLIFVGGCTKPMVSHDHFGESSSDAVKLMADKAIQVCGKGNVKSVTVSNFQCFEDPKS